MRERRETTLRPVMRFDRPSEWPRIKALFDDSFGRDAESALVETLRADGAFAFMIVAETPEGFIGACGFSPLPILRQDETGGETTVDGAALAPACGGERLPRSGRRLRLGARRARPVPPSQPRPRLRARGGALFRSARL